MIPRRGRPSSRWVGGDTRWLVFSIMHSDVVIVSSRSGSVTLQFGITVPLEVCTMFVLGHLT